jgi:hypothetical protein
MPGHLLRHAAEQNPVQVAMNAQQLACRFYFFTQFDTI